MPYLYVYSSHRHVKRAKAGAEQLSCMKPLSQDQKLFNTTVRRCAIDFTSICTRNCLAAELRPDPQESLQRSAPQTTSVAVLGWGQGGTGPPNLAQAPQIFRVITVHKLLNTGQLDAVVLLVVASQMMRGQAPQIFFLEPPLDHLVGFKG